MNRTQVNSMNELMIEMGHTGSTEEDLTELREQGLRAIYISNVPSIGLTELNFNE